MKLKEICENITDGSHNPPSGIDSSEYLMLSSKNIFDDKITLEEPRYLSEEQFLAEDKRTCIKAGDVLMTIVGTVGRAAVVTADIPKITLQRSVAVLHPHSDVCNSRFLMYLLRSKKNFFEQEAHGVAQKGIYLKQLSEISVSIPAISQQEDIVDKLDRINKIIKSRQLELDKLGELIKARFVEMFGDPESAEKYPQIAIKDFTDVISGGTPDRKNNQYWENGTVPWVKTTELQNKRINSVEECITEKGLNESSAKVVPENTVLIAMYGQGKTRGMTAILGIPASTNQACACILPCETVEPKYLWQYMIMSYDRLRNLAQGGNQPNLNGNMIKNFTVLVPPVELQMQFVKFVEQVDKSKVAVQKSLDETQLLFNSLMQKYFG